MNKHRQVLGTCLGSSLWQSNLASLWWLWLPGPLALGKLISWGHLFSFRERLNRKENSQFLFLPSKRSDWNYPGRGLSLKDRCPRTMKSHYVQKVPNIKPGKELSLVQREKTPFLRWPGKYTVNATRAPEAAWLGSSALADVTLKALNLCSTELVWEHNYGTTKLSDSDVIHLSNQRKTLTLLNSNAF